MKLSAYCLFPPKQARRGRRHGHSPRIPGRPDKGNYRAAEKSSWRVAYQYLGQEGNSAPVSRQEWWKPNPIRKSSISSIKILLPVKTLTLDDRVRVCAWRDPVFATAPTSHRVMRCMPPTMLPINIGAYVDEGTRWWTPTLWLDHALRSARRVHLSAAAQIGGVLEPPPSIARDHR